MMQPESAASNGEPDSPAIKCRLSPEAIALLGTKSDKKIAAEHGVSSETVKYHRTKRGIPAFCFEVVLRNDSDFMGKLGKVSDHQLGTQYGCSNATVRGIRVGLGIPAFKRTLDISEELRQALGKKPDSDVAALFGVPAEQISAARKALGVPAYTKASALAGSDEFKALLAEQTNQKLAAQFECSSNTVSRLRKDLKIPPLQKKVVDEVAAWYEAHLAEIIPLLGKVSDYALARRYGTFQTRITRLRNQRGIPPLNAQTTAKPKVTPEPAKPTRRSGRRPTYSLPEEVHDKLGVLSDAELSRQSGIPREHILTHRNILGIKPARNRVPLADGLIESLGKMTDPQVAEKFGRPLKWVKTERVKRGIPRFRVEDTPGLAELLGTMPDEALANKLDLSVSTVRRVRNERGIPSFQKKTGD